MKFLKRMLEKIRKADSRRGYVCDGCGVEIFTYPIQRLCDDCEVKMRKNNGLRCGKCGRPTRAEGVCLNCKSKLPQFNRGIAPFCYRGETAAFVNRIKNGKRRLAYFFGERMADELLTSYPAILQFDKGRYALNEENSQEKLLILPVPMTENTRKSRGYNQAEELALSVCERLEEKGIATELAMDVLQKRRETAQQKHMTHTERAENVAGAYHVHKRTTCKGRTIVLVDDIMTTGATGSECAARLLGVGAKEVIFLVAAALPEQK